MSRAGARIAELGFGQKHASPGGGEVELLVGGWIEGARGAPGFSIRVRAVSPDGREAGGCVCPVSPGGGGSFHASLRLSGAPLWWLSGLGAPALHVVEVGLDGPDGKRLDSVSRRVGLRTLECETRADGSRAPPAGRSSGALRDPSNHRPVSASPSETMVRSAKPRGVR